MASLSELIGIEPSEELRTKLLKQEFKLRKKQPEAWTKTKYRPYANFRAKKKEEVTNENNAKKIAIIEA
jgi:hypothetical protein